MKKSTIFLAFLLLASFSAIAQMQITGKVTNTEDGMPIPGVSIIVKGASTIGTTTDIDGKYSISVPSSAKILEFSFVGMEKQEVEINGRTVINISMKTGIHEMERVVVTALGISREKKALGYSVQQVEGASLNEANQTDALSALQGRVAGVQIRSTTNMGGSSKILIRGASSLLGDNNPLIVVDGVPLDNTNFNATETQTGSGGVDYGSMLNDLAPSEIESMSILKGAAAALYGSRAANGVIIITTKRAKKGAEGFSVDFNSSVNFEKIYILPELQNKYGGGAIITEGKGGVNGFQQITIDGKNYLIAQYGIDESWGPRYNENIQVLHWDAWSKKSFPNQYLQTRPWVAPENDVETFWDLGVSYKNNLGVSKTGKNYGVRFAYTNTIIEGTMPGSEMNKNSFKLAANAAISKKLTIRSILNFSTHYAKGRPTIGYTDNSVGQKFFQWGQRQLDYKRLRDYKTIDGVQRPWNRRSWDNATPKYADNPYWTAFENRPEDTRNRFYGNINLNYQITNDLSASAGAYGDTYTFFTRERISLGSQALSYYQEVVRNRSEYNYEFRLNYKKNINKIFIGAVAGANRRDVRYDLNSGITSGGLIVSDIFALENSKNDPILRDYTEERHINSLLGQVSLSYDRFLNLEVSLRNDWSSALPDDNNSYFYYGVSGSFVASELFKIPYVDLLKIRGGYTQVGNDTDPYRVKSTFYYDRDGSFRGTPRLAAERELVNPDLKAEITTTTEAGLDLNLFVNRVNLALTYFKKTTKDQIFGLEISKATGYDTKLINAGELSSKGWEVTLGGIPVKTKDFEWNVNFNYTKSKMVVEELEDKNKEDRITSIDIARSPFRGVYLRASEGDEYGQLWGYDFIYDENGNKVLNEKGMYRRTDRLVPLGSVYPDYNLGISSNFRYKNFDLNLLFDIQKGGKFYSVSHMFGMASGMLEETAGVNDKGNEIRNPASEGGGILLDGVIGDVAFNDDGTYTVSNTRTNNIYASGEDWARAHYLGYGGPSAQNVFDADYIKLREISFGYSYPKPLIRGFIKTLKISVYGRNIATWGLDKKGFDPEITVAGSGNIQGIEGGLQPASRSFGVNLKVKF
ncbi:MAG: SusC/RagA family TonB-linked outer membrane protein [Bacteroidales bacterium]|nr:SusC/RagA family TonB-linked outer membrane protein [Bacteroidales bacterium]